MLVLLDTNEDLDVCAKEMNCEVDQLLTPLTRFSLRRPGRRFAIDNGAFSRFDKKSFLSLLERERSRKADCIFVTVPDVVGSARRTLEVFHRWKGQLEGWNLALAIQDGQGDLEIPWDEIQAVFIGGSTEFKMSDEAIQVIKTAKILDKWVHVGRINTVERFKHFEGIADSCDGSGLAQYTHMRLAIARRNYQPKQLELANAG